MAKEIPYFKFFIGEWANGDITCESYEAQGIFINICSIYWAKLGNLTESHIRKKFKSDEAINELIEASIIKIEDGKVIINFLDEQFEEDQLLRRVKSAGGKKSAEKRKKIKTTSTGVKDQLKTSSSNNSIEQNRTEDIKSDKVLKTFDITSFENLEMRLKTSKAEIKIKLEEFLEIEKITPTFKNKQIGEILKHFRNWLNYNKPKEITNKQTKAPWIDK
tara:strand:+ start:853 stop:1509 length:657 start_codon:yes stop_codon:yes gene_type:complete